MSRRLPRSVVAVAAAAAGLLLSVAGRYGYHRDELYFLACGRHLAWGYPDQPPVVPLLARAADEVAPHSLLLLRLPSALAVAAIVVVTGLLARELGGDRPAQALAAVVIACSAVVLGAGHLLSTTTFGLLAWALTCWLVVRILRGASPRWWLGVGLVVGIGLLDNTLIAFLVAALLVSALLVGPRDVLASPWLAVGAVIAGGLWAPYLVWQARHGWPQLDVAGDIASGGSGSSAPRWTILPFQFLLLGPGFAPVWVTGLVRLLRASRLRRFRALGVAWGLLLVVFVVVGGKPYYLAGLFPVLVATGAQPAVEWARASRRRLVAVVVAFAVTLPGIAVALPVLPLPTVRALGVVDLNYDVGETIGWPAYVGTIGRVARAAGVTAVLASNYGEAGAVERYGEPWHLRAYSGHNGWWWWGPPPATTTRLVAVGFAHADLAAAFTRVRLVTRLDNGVDVDDDEQGEPVWVCDGPRRSWTQLWPQFRTIG